MDSFLPWAAFGAAALATLLAVRPWAQVAGAETGSFWKGWTASRPRYIVTLLICLVVFGTGALWPQELRGLTFIGYGMLVGAFLAILSHLFEMGISERVKTLILPVGFAAAAGGAALLFENNRAEVFLGSALGALFASLFASGRWSRVTAILITASTSAAVIGSHREDIPRAIGCATLLLTVAVPCLGIANAWSEYASRQSGKQSLFWPGLVAGALLLGGAKLIGAKYLFLNDVFLLGLGGVACAACVSWLLRDEEQTDVTALGLAALIWVAWTTVAFGLMKGFGVGISAVIAGAMLAAVGGNRAWLSFTVIVAYTLYRVFLEEYPKDSKAIDIGQHYAVMGIIAGAILPIVVGNWISAVRARTNELFLTILAGSIGLLLVFGMTFVIGARGSVGFLIGTAMTAMLLGIAKTPRLGIAVLGLSFGTALVTVFRYLSPHIGLDREVKLSIVVYGVVAAALLILTAYWTLRLEGEKSTNGSLA